MKQVPLGDRRLTFEFADVGAGDERFLSGPGDDKYADLPVAAKLVEGSDTFGMNGFVQGVQFVRPVDGKYGYLAAKLDADGLKIGHGIGNNKTGSRPVIQVNKIFGGVQRRCSILPRLPQRCRQRSRLRTAAANCLWIRRSTHRHATYHSWPRSRERQSP